ncbi:MAG: hypothetical protein M5U18_14950 [Dehalococcoidia bacterium]|nr:hypothetical protein [Dehalococcoidia bacterium]
MPVRRVVAGVEARVVPVRAEVVVNHVQDDREAQPVGRVDEPAQAVRPPYTSAGAKSETPSYPQFHRPGNEATGINSTAETPSPATAGRTSIAASNVPSLVRVPM